MKKQFVFILTAVLIFTLTACGACEHEWTAADCINAAVCGKCKETGEPAFGHDFAAATCQTPETCSRCGETQGEPLPHRFGDWLLEKDQMVRTCADCAAEERSDADLEQYLLQVLPGHWDYSGEVLDGTQYGPDDLRYMAVGFYATMFEDGTCRIYTGSRLFESVKWSYSSHEYSESSGNVFSLNLEFQEGLEAVMTLQVKDGKQNLYFFYNDENYAIMEKHPQIAEALAGSWSGTLNGSLFSLELKEDRTLSGDLNGPVTGTWHLEPMKVSGGYRSMNVTFYYTQDNRVNGFNSTLNLGYEDEPLEEHLKNIRLSMWDMKLGSVLFEKLDSVSTSRIQAALEQGPKMILGTWTSETLEFNVLGASEQTKKDTCDYSLTFTEDGTVTAVFDKSYTGSWKFDKAETPQDYVAYYDYPTYSYQILLEGLERPAEVRIIGPGRIYMGASNETHSMFCWFNQTDDGGIDHAALAPELLIGQWDAVEQVQNTDQGTVVQIPTPGTYTLTVQADGTFTANFGKQTAGQWNYSEHTFSSGYCFAFLHEGQDGGMVYTIYTPGQLRAFFEIDGIHYGFTMKKQ